MRGYTLAMRTHFAAIFNKIGSQNVRVSALGTALVNLEHGFNSMRAAVAPIIAQRERLPYETVRSALEVSVPIDADGRLDTLPLEFGAVDPERPGFDLHPRLAAIFWRFTARTLLAASEGRGEILSASGADSFVGAARSAQQAECNLLLSHRRDEHPWVPDVDFVRVAPGLERYAEARKRYVRVETEIVGQIIAMSFEPLGFTLKTTDGNVRVLALARQEEQLRRLGGGPVIAKVSARVNRDGHVVDATLIDLDSVRTTRDPLAYFHATRGAGRGMWSTPEAREYLASLRAEHEAD